MSKALNRIDVNAINEAKQLVITMLSVTHDSEQIEVLENLMLRLTTVWVKAKVIEEQGHLV